MFSVIIVTAAKKENASSKSWIFYIGTTTEKLSWLDNTMRVKNDTTSKMNILRKRVQKLKTFLLHFMTTFHNFALQIETSWAKSVVNPILETN